MSPHGVRMQVVLAAMIPIVLAQTTGPPVTTITPMAVEYLSAILRPCETSDVGGCWHVKIRATFTSGAFGGDDTVHATDETISSEDVTIEADPTKVGDVYTWIIEEYQLLGNTGSEYSVSLDFTFTETFTFTSDMTQADTFSETVTVTLESTPFGSVSSGSSVSQDNIVRFALARFYTVNTDSFVQLTFHYNVDESQDVGMDLTQSELSSYCPSSGEGPSTIHADACAEAEFAMNHTCEITALDDGLSGMLFFPVTGLDAPYTFDLLFTTSQWGTPQGLQRFLLSVAPVGGIELCSAQNTATVNLVDDVSVTFYSGIGANPPSVSTSLNPSVIAGEELVGGSVRSESLITMALSTSSTEPFTVSLRDIYVVYDWESGVVASDLNVAVGSSRLTFADLEASFNCSASAGYQLATAGECSFYHSDGVTLDANHVRRLDDETSDKNWLRNTYLPLGSTTASDGIIDDFYDTVTNSKIDSWWLNPFADGYAKTVFVSALFEIIPTGDISGSGRRLMQASASTTVDGVTTATITYDVTPEEFIASSLGIPVSAITRWTFVFTITQAEGCLLKALLSESAKNRLLQAMAVAASGVLDVQVVGIDVNNDDIDCRRRAGIETDYLERRLLASGAGATMVVDAVVIMDPAAENAHIDLAELLSVAGIVSAVQQNPDASDVFSESSELPSAEPTNDDTIPGDASDDSDSVGADNTLPTVAVGSAAGVIIIGVGAVVWARRKVAHTRREADDQLMELTIRAQDAEIVATLEGVGSSGVGLRTRSKTEKKMQDSLIDDVFLCHRDTMMGEKVKAPNMEATIEGRMASSLTREASGTKGGATVMEEVLLKVRPTMATDSEEAELGFVRSPTAGAPRAPSVLLRQISAPPDLEPSRQHMRSSLQELEAATPELSREPSVRQGTVEMVKEADKLRHAMHEEHVDPSTHNGANE